MASSKEDLKKLNAIWYVKLKEAGFVDIEKKNGRLKQPSPMAELYDRRKGNREIYFQMLMAKLSDPSTVFRNFIHRYILIRHADGAPAVIIVRELRAAGLSRTRDSVRFIIRRYEMLWNIRHYTRTQLNLRPFTK